MRSLFALGANMITNQMHLIAVGLGICAAIPFPFKGIGIGFIISPTLLIILSLTLGFK